MDQEVRVKSPELVPHKYSQPIFYKAKKKKICGGKNSFSANGAATIEYLSTKSINLDKSHLFQKLTQNFPHSKYKTQYYETYTGKCRRKFVQA